MHHNQHTRSARSPWLGSLLGLSTLSLLLGGISCSSDPGGEDGTIPPGTVVDSCPPGYTCETNGDGMIVIVGGGNGSGGATSSGGASGVGGDPSASGGGTSSGGNGDVGAGGTATDPSCTDEQHPDQLDQPCSIWLEWGDPPGAHCNDEWLQGYCDATCGRCTPSSGTGGDSGSGGGGNGSGGWGNDVTLPDINGGEVYHATRYWDCCKHHCAWPGHDRGTAKSCGSDGTTLVSDNTGSACAGEGNAHTCYSDAPYAVSDTVSYGTIARRHENATCGECYHIQFTGEGHYSGSDPGSQRIAGKHMIVKVSNTGSDVNNRQFDLLIPGGGVGQNPGTCSQQWGVPDGETHGGYLADCGGSYEQKKQCVQNKCAQLPAGDARAGCEWFVDWFEIADNPKFRFEPIACPSDMRF